MDKSSMIVLYVQRKRLGYDLSEEFGLVKSEMAVNVGHGRVRIVKPASKEAVTFQIRF